MRHHSSDGRTTQHNRLGRSNRCRTRGPWRPFNQSAYTTRERAGTLDDHRAEFDACRSIFASSFAPRVMFSTIGCKLSPQISTEYATRDERLRERLTQGLSSHFPPFRRACPEGNVRSWGSPSFGPTDREMISITSSSKAGRTEVRGSVVHLLVQAHQRLEMS